MTTHDTPVTALHTLPTLPEAPDDWARLWFSLADRPWRALALVPARDGGTARAMADALARVAASYGGQRVVVLDAARATPPDVPAALRALAERTERGMRVLVAAASPMSHPPSIPLARAADTAVMCVGLGTDELALARRAMEQVGASRFVGSITMDMEHAR